MLILILLYLFSFSNVEPLAVSNIPLDLLVSASAVVRYDQVHSHIESSSSIEVEVKTAVTILSKDGIGAGHVSIYYNGEEDKIKNLKIEIYDANGVVVSKIKKKEIDDQSVYDGFSIANDSRVKFYHHVSNSYPYTVVYSYIKTSKNTLNTPYWLPLKGTGISLQVLNLW